MKWQIDRFLFSNKFHSFAKSMDTILSLALFAQFGSSAMIICSTVYLLSIVSRNVQSSKFIISQFMSTASGGLGLGRAMRQEYFGGPSFFLRGHRLPKFDSFFYTPRTPVGVPRAWGPEALPHRPLL